MEAKYLVEVVFPQPIVQTYSYLSKEYLKPGKRVVVYLRKSLTLALVYQCIEITPEEEALVRDYKWVVEVLDEEPIYPQKLFPLLENVASYYLVPLGLVFKTALPIGLFKIPAKKIRLTEKGRHLAPVKEKSPYAFLKLLLPKEMNYKTFIQRSGLKDEEIKRLQAEGLVELRIDLPVKKIPMERIVKVVKREDLPEELKRAFSFSDEMPYEVLRQRISRQSISFYLRKRYLEVYEVLKLRKINFLTDELGDYTLTTSQQEVLESIWREVRQFNFQPLLLHGVTGSGKTLIYLELIKRVVQNGKRVLILLPEIALTSYMERHLLREFGPICAVLHSGLPSSQRVAEWLRVVRGEAWIVLGTRSAVFAPINDLGLIIVDEEHDPSYKEENFHPKYNARDVALLRGKLEKVPVLLGSATPSIKSYYFGKTEKYKLFYLTTRPFGELPELKLVENRGFKLFAEETLKEIKITVASGRSVFVFLNRRGYAPIVRCEDCQYIFTCVNCDLPLTYHLEDRSLRCHHCYWEIKHGFVCPQCGSTFVKYLRAGTERVEEELCRLFPEVEVIRFDRDTAGSEKRLNLLLTKLYEPKPKIIVSTQMGVHGHNFPGVNLVVILRAEEGLLIPSYKSAERTFQILMQAAGRAGRWNEKGKVLIQTAFPEHYVVRQVLQQDYQAFYQEEIQRRREFGYPPFVRLGIIQIRGIKEEKIIEGAERLWKELKSLKKKEGLQVQIFPPHPCPLRRIKGFYRWQILLKSPFHSSLAKILSTARNYKFPGLRLDFDLDPEDLM